MNPNWDADSPYGLEDDGQFCFWFFFEVRMDRQGRTPHGLTHEFWAAPLSPRSCWFGL